MHPEKHDGFHGKAITQGESMVAKYLEGKQIDEKTQKAELSKFTRQFCADQFKKADPDTSWYILRNSSLGENNYALSFREAGKENLENRRLKKVINDNGSVSYVGVNYNNANNSTSYESVDGAIKGFIGNRYTPLKEPSEAEVSLYANNYFHSLS